MTIDPTITLGNLITVAVLVAGVISAWFVLRGEVATTKVTITDLKESHDALAKSYAALLKRVEEIRAKGAHELADYKLEVAREYATTQAIKEVEERLIGAINRLVERFDKYFDRDQVVSGRRRGQP